MAQWDTDRDTGQVLAGRYRLLRPLGEGGISRAYLARDEVSQADVVLKSARRRADGVLLARELELLRGLYHPGLVAALDLFVDRGRPVMVCAWAPGDPLSRLPSDAPAHAELLPELAGQLAAVLAFLHAMGIAHGDVKADNVVVDGGRATLLDLSAARRGAGQSQGHSRGHAAPETEADGEASFASDVFALARMLVTAGAPPALRTALADCLSAEPRDRPSARELAERLGADRRSLGRATLRSRFVGRGAELGVVADAMVRASTGACVVVTGERGMGKTRLLRESRWRAALKGPTFALEDDEPLASLLSRAFAGAAPRSLHEAMALAEKAAAEDRALVIDDADRLPDLDRAWLRALAARPELRVAWILSARSVPEGLPASVREVPLGPIEEMAVRAWVEGAGLDPARVREAGGVPGALVELDRARAESAAALVRPSARRAVALLEAAGGQALGAEDMRAFGAEEASLAELIDAGVARRVAGGFVIDERRLLPDLDEARRAAHAFLLLRAKDGPARWTHASLAGDRLETARAIEDLRALAAAPTAELARAARRLAGAPLAESRVFAASVLERAGDARAASTALLRAALVAPAALRDDVRLVLGRLFGRKGDARGLRVLARVSRHGHVALVEETILLLKLGRFSEARARARETLAQGDAVDPATRADLEVSQALAESWLGDLASPVARLTELARAPADAHGATPRSRFRVLSACATVHLRAGEADRARAFYAEALAEARTHGLDDLSRSVTVNHAVACHQAGDYGRAHREYLRALDLSRATGARATLALVTLYIARLYADLDLHARARDALLRLEPSQLAALSAFHLGIRDCLEAEVLAATGALPEARALAERAIVACADAPRERTEASLVLLDIAIRRHERELGRELSARLEAEVTAPGTADLAARRAELASMLARDEGRGDEAVRLARLALDEATRANKRRLVARIHGLLARTYRGEGAHAAARPHDEAAARLTEELWAELPVELRGPPPAAAAAPRASPASGEATGLVHSLLRVVRATTAADAHALVVEEALRVTRAERGFLLLRDGEDDEPVVASARNVDRESIKKPRGKYGRSIARRAMDSGEPILLADAQDDGAAASSRSGTAHRLGLRSVLCVPLFRDGASRGALYLDNRFAHGAFTAADERAARSLVDALASLLARFDAESALARKLLRAERAPGALPFELAPLPGIPIAVTSPFPQLPTRSARLAAALSTLARVVDVDVPILVRGESGTGKELVARALHAHGARRDGPFVAINCGALPEMLLEAELFGHVRGAFTGATHDKAGLFVAARGGVVFLDEIGEMPASMQVKLLRVLQEREVRPLGATDTVRIDVRIVSATHRDLRREVAEGRFREDLYYRAAVVDVELPPLRDRLEDLGPLVDVFLERLRRQSGIARTLAPATRAQLARHRWPGNVRELENVLVRAFFLTDGDVIDTIPGLEITAAKPRARRGEDERRRMEEALAREDWNVRKAARDLGIPRATFYRRLERYGLARAADSRPVDGRGTPEDG